MQFVLKGNLAELSLFLTDKFIKVAMKVGFLRTRCAIGPVCPPGIRLTPTGQNTSTSPVPEPERHPLNRQPGPGSGAGSSRRSWRRSGEPPAGRRATLRRQQQPEQQQRPPSGSEQQQDAAHSAGTVRPESIQERAGQQLRAEPSRAALSSGGAALQIPIAAPEKQLPPPGEERRPSG